jgi:signal transduction histidine kinase
MLIGSAFANLLSNAIQHAPAGSIIRVETHRRDDGMLLSIRDHGPGIPADELTTVFERYARGAKAAGSTSTGLGLYLVKTIVEAHGGSVSVALPADGGSAFPVFLPGRGP